MTFRIGPGFPGGLAVCLVAHFALPIGGCSRGPATAPVEGIVRLDGQPLTVGTVRFTPAVGRAAQGNIQSDGTFSLSTFSSSDGALVGQHGVSITAYAAPTGQPNYDVDKPTEKSPVPGWYASADSSGLTFEVKAGESNFAKFELSSK